MHYSQGAGWRPLIDGESAMLQVATGCSHNKCIFCDMYHKPFAVSPIDEIAADIKELSIKTQRDTKRLFLTGGNSFCLPTELLLDICALVRESMPFIESIGCFARISDIKKKTNAELEALAKAGLGSISIGAESGLDKALAAVGKGFSAQDVIDQCARLDKVRMTYAFFYLLGIAGKGRGLDNARSSAKVFGSVNPQVIMVHTMTRFEGTKLAHAVAEGKFKMASEKEMQQELREFCALYPKKTLINAAHFSNTISFIAQLPDERTELLDLIDKRIDLDDEEVLTQRRMQMQSI